MAEIRWDIKRSADIYRQILDARLKFWISTGKIKPGEVIVWRGGFSGWRRPEELEELIPYFRRYERSQLRKIKKRKSERGALPEKTQIKNILIIDDEKDLCQLLGDTLSSHGYNVKFAHTKKDALSGLKSQTPDLVFCDLKLPDGDGMRILSKIRKISPGTIVNIITAYGSEEARDEARKLGAYGFIDKPFSEEAILRNIRELCKTGVS
jgi:CheY-like chemotaxis protein